MESIRRSPIIEAITILLLGVVAFDLMNVAVRLLLDGTTTMQKPHPQTNIQTIHQK